MISRNDAIHLTQKGYPNPADAVPAWHQVQEYLRANPDDRVVKRQAGGLLRIIRIAPQGEAAQKYDPDQPRWPQGHKWGGRWRTGASIIASFFADKYRSFHGLDDASEWADSHYDPMDYSARHRTVLYNYSAGYSAVINGSLRQNNEFNLEDPVTRMHLENLDEAIEWAPSVPEDLRGYRGFWGYTQLIEDFDNNEIVGKVYQDKGFTSVSLAHEVSDAFAGGEEGVMAHIAVPKGTRAAYITSRHKPATSEWDQAELILARGGAYRVVDKWRDKNGERHILMEVVKDGDELQVPPEEIEEHLRVPKDVRAPEPDPRFSW